MSDQVIKCAAKMVVALVSLPPEQRLDALALVCKLTIEGKLERFE